MWVSVRRGLGDQSAVRAAAAAADVEARLHHSKRTLSLSCLFSSSPSLSGRVLAPATHWSMRRSTVAKKIGDSIMHRGRAKQRGRGERRGQTPIREGTGPGAAAGHRDVPAGNLVLILSGKEESDSFPLTTNSLIWFSFYQIGWCLYFLWAEVSDSIPSPPTLVPVLPLGRGGNRVSHSSTHPLIH